MSLTPQQASELLREKFRTMTEEEFIRIATKYSPTLLQDPEPDTGTGPIVTVFSSESVLTPIVLTEILASMGLSWSDREIEPILRILANVQVVTVGDLTRLASGGRAARVYDMLALHRADRATAFDFIASLAEARSAENLSDFESRTITFLGILDEFERLQSAS